MWTAKQKGCLTIYRDGPTVKLQNIGRVHDVKQWNAPEKIAVIASKASNTYVYCGEIVDDDMYPSMCCLPGKYIGFTDLENQMIVEVMSGDLQKRKALVDLAIRPETEALNYLWI